MVLGVIVYEAFDVAYNIGKLGYNGVTGLYNWYYQIEDPIIKEKKKEIKKIEELESKIDELSKLFVQSNLKEKCEKLNLKSCN